MRSSQKEGISLGRRDCNLGHTDENSVIVCGACENLRDDDYADGEFFQMRNELDTFADFVAQHAICCSVLPEASLELRH